MFIDPFYFFIAFVVGLIYTFITKPKTEIITKYPTPHNTDIKYIDDAGVCYKYKVKISSCPQDKTNINNMSIIN